RAGEQEEMKPRPRPVRDPARSVPGAQVGLPVAPLRISLTQAPLDPAPVPVRGRLRAQPLLLLNRGERFRLPEGTSQDGRRSGTREPHHQQNHEGDLLAHIPVVGWSKEALNPSSGVPPNGCKRVAEPRFPASSPALYELWPGFGEHKETNHTSRPE